MSIKNNLLSLLVYLIIQTTFTINVQGQSSDSVLVKSDISIGNNTVLAKTKNITADSVLAKSDSSHWDYIAFEKIKSFINYIGETVFTKKTVTEPDEINSITTTPFTNYILIDYNFDGILEAQYEITLLMKNKKDPSFLYKIGSSKAQGDVGKIAYSKKQYSIRWYPTKELLQQVNSNDAIYFDVEILKSTTNISWLYVGGVVAITGGAAMLLTALIEAAPIPIKAVTPPGRP